MTNFYHKINGPYKRDMDKKTKPLLIDDWALPEFEMLKDVYWVGREKLDGTNIVVTYDNIENQLTFNGRTERASIPPMLIEHLERTFSKETMSYLFPDGVTLYGEGIGHKIQSGGKYVNGEKIVDFVLFDVKVGKWWLNDDVVDEIASDLGITVAPIVIGGNLKSIMEEVSDGFMSSWGDFYAEGIVAKPQIQLFDRAGNRIVTKIKHKDFFGKL